jgi:hypothetical protein
MCKPVGKPHKHAAAIIAWASGHKIEWRDPSAVDPWKICYYPQWYLEHEYRVYTEPPTDRVVYAHVRRKNVYGA